MEASVSLFKAYFYTKLISKIIVNKGETNWMKQLMILLVINSSSTCFGRLYAHRQEVRLRFHCLSFSVLL